MLFGKLLKSREAIERKADRQYEWKDPTSDNRARVYVQRDAEIANRQRWPEYQAWLKTEVERMFRVVVPKAKQLANCLPTPVPGDS